MIEADTHPLLRAAIETKDSHALCVYADWLADMGDPLSEGWRWLGEAKRMPLFTRHRYTAWFRKSDWPISNDGDELPDAVFDALEGWDRLDGDPPGHSAHPAKVWTEGDAYVRALAAAAQAYLKVHGRANDRS